MKKDLLKIEDIYEALTLLPILSDYTEPGVRSVSELALCINNSEALLNLLIYFSGKHIRFPKIEDVELTLKLLLAYKYNIVSSTRCCVCIPTIPVSRLAASNYCS